jgi:hypothetical protein
MLSRSQILISTNANKFTFLIKSRLLLFFRIQRSNPTERCKQSKDYFAIKVSLNES